MEHMPRIAISGFSVDFIPEYRVSDRVEMHTNLMGAPGEYLAQNERPRGLLVNYLVGGVRSSSEAGYRHFLPVHRMSPDRLDDFAALPGEFSGAHCQVKLSDLASGKLAA